MLSVWLCGCFNGAVLHLHDSCTKDCGSGMSLSKDEVLNLLQDHHWLELNEVLESVGAFSMWDMEQMLWERSQIIKSSCLMLVFAWEKDSFLSEDSGQCRAMWGPDWLTDRQRRRGGGRGWISTLTACHSFLCCHKSLPSPLKVRPRWLLADLRASPGRHMSFYQPRPRWHCGGRVLTPPLMRNGKKCKGGKS